MERSDSGIEPSPRRKRRRWGPSEAATADPPPPTPTNPALSPLAQALQEAEELEEKRSCRRESGYHDNSSSSHDDDDDEALRRRALDWLERTLADWAREDCGSNGDADDNDQTSPSPVVIPFGSYRLRCHRPSADLDVLVLAAAPHCNRDGFFSTFVARLRQLEQKRSVDDPAVAVRDVHSISTAHTPVVKCTLFGNRLPMDLLFANGDTDRMRGYHQQREEARQQKATRQEEDNSSSFSDNEYYDFYEIDDADVHQNRGDAAGLRSLNGARVAQMILQSMGPRLSTFRIVLRAVKHWATARGIYSNVLGFLGGINCAIMVAYVCLQNPSDHPKTPEALLEQFFRTFAAWNWPEPVRMAPSEQLSAQPESMESSSSASDALPLIGWNPAVNPRDRSHIMPIITPAYPCMNSAYNVDGPQLRRMTHEMTLAANELARAARTESLSRPQDPPEHVRETFRQLLEQSDFVAQHKHFLQVTVTSRTRMEHVTWLRLVESRLRMLIAALETPRVQAWPFARCFHKPRAPQKGSLQPLADKTDMDGDENDGQGFESIFLIALRFAPGTRSIDLRRSILDFCQGVDAWENRTAGMDLDLTHVLASELPDYVVSSCRPVRDEASVSDTVDQSHVSADTMSFKHVSGKTNREDSQGDEDQIKEVHV